MKVGPVILGQPSRDMHLRSDMLGLSPCRSATGILVGFAPITGWPAISMYRSKLNWKYSRGCSTCGREAATDGPRDSAEPIPLPPDIVVVPLPGLRRLEFDYIRQALYYGLPPGVRLSCYRTNPIVVRISYLTDASWAMQLACFSSPSRLFSCPQKCYPWHRGWRQVSEKLRVEGRNHELAGTLLEGCLCSDHYWQPGCGKRRWVSLGLGSV